MVKWVEIVEEMEYLKKLIAFFPPQQMARLHRLGPLDPESKMGQLYQGIVQNRWKDEEAAQAELYGAFQGKSRTAFSKLKTQLKKRLLQLIFLTGLKEDQLPPEERRIQDCYRLYFSGLLLIRRGARKIAIPLLEQAFRQAQKVEATSVALETARLLRNHAAVIEGSQKSFVYYHEKIEQLKARYNLEMEADAMQEELLSHYVLDKSSKPYLQEKAVSYRKALKHQSAGIDSRHLQHRYFSITVLERMIAHDYDQTAAYCEEAIEFFNKQTPAPPRHVLRTYWFQLLVCSLQLKDAERGKRALSGIQSYLRHGSSNWLKAQELTCILHLHFSDYQQAYDHWSQVVTQRLFHQLFPTQLEPWIILEAFIHFLIATENVRDTNGKQRAPFRLAKFLNEVPLYSKDKRGYNIPILIVQVLFLLKRREWDRAMDRIDSLQGYANRYVRQRDALRSHCFIRMLDQLPKCGFRRKWVQEKTQVRLQRLKAILPEQAGEPFEVEIIPYERLWSLILDQLR